MLIVNLDVMLARRKMSVTELAQRVGITPGQHLHIEKRQSKGHSFFHAGENLSVLECQPGDILEYRED